LDNSDKTDVTKNKTDTDRNKNIVGIVVAMAVGILVLSWAVSTFFGFSLVKSLAGVILVLFGIAVALFMTGIG
jgi:hypothetical protein